MTRKRNPRLEGLSAFALTSMLAVWVGGSIVIDAAVVPTVFEQLPRQQAADLGGILFYRWNFAESILGILTVFLATAMGRAAWGTPRRHVTATAILSAMTLVVLAFLLALTPAITSKIETLKTMAVDLADRTAMPPERQAMHTLHTLYAALDVAKILAGLAVIYLLATRRPR